MKMLVVSESRGESAGKAATVLDSYLPRVGKRTWLGGISAEGAEDLKRALRSVATKATAIMGRQVGNSKHSAPSFIVGRRDAFGAGGVVPVSWTRRNRRIGDKTELHRLVVSVTCLAAWFHDLGKLTVGFNGVLEEAVSTTGRKAKAQPVRHELLSLVMLHHAVEKAGSKGDRQFLEAISEPGRVIDIFAAALKNFPDVDGWAGSFSARRSSTTSESLSIARFLPSRDTHPIVRAVCDLVISHHRLPSGAFREVSGPDKAAYSVETKDAMHVARPKYGRIPDTLPWNGFLQASPNAVVALSDPGVKWNVGVAGDARRALDVIAETPAFDARELSWSALHFGRLALMLGDHQASMASVARPMSSEHVKAAIALNCFANTKHVAPNIEGDAWEPDIPFGDDTLSAPSTSEPPCPERGVMLADTWQQHTHKVRRRAGLAIGHLLRPGDWPELNEDDLPDALTSSEPETSPFRWQDEAARDIASAAESMPNAAWLVFLTASTGTGKTVAVPKILLATRRRKSLRLNVALGLRSLTLQTGDDYLGRMGFASDQAMVSIGSKAALMMHGVQDDDDASNAMQAGTDAEIEDASDILVGGSENVILNGMAERAAMLDRNPGARAKMLSTPILVSTIDRLMSAADARRGGHLNDMLRLATSDLSIDEIDSYEPEDFVAIMRLVRIAASYGRSVVIASATLRHGHASAVREAFAAGQRTFAATHGLKREFGTAWVSEHGTTVHADDMASNQDAKSAFSARHRLIAAGMAASAAKSHVRRRACVVSTAGKGHFAAAFETGLALHGDNHAVDPATGIRVSVGIVRFNRVRSARAFGMHVASEPTPHGVGVAMACYHAKFTLSVKTAIYARISKMLTRKCLEGDPDPILSNPDIRHKLLKASIDGITDLVCYLSTTNIIEVGNDLDADWGISEPCSERSVSQLAGRIRRHRLWRHAGVNLAILDTCAPRTNGSDIIERPGVETSLRSSPGYKSFRSSLPGKRNATEIFPVDAWAERIDNGRCLTDAPSTCADAEVAMLEGSGFGNAESVSKLREVGEAGKRPPSPPKLANVRSLSVDALVTCPDALWTDYHAANRRFRRGDSRVPLDLMRYRGNWMARNRGTIAAAKSGGTLGWFAEWVDSNNRVEADYATLVRTLEHLERLLFEVEIYDMEKSAVKIASAIESRGGAVPEYLKREFRTTSLQMFPSAEGVGRVNYNAVLGFDVL